MLRRFLGNEISVQAGLAIEPLAERTLAKPPQHEERFLLGKRLIKFVQCQLLFLPIHNGGEEETDAKTSDVAEQRHNDIVVIPPTPELSQHFKQVGPDEKKGDRRSLKSILIQPVCPSAAIAHK